MDKNSAAEDQRCRECEEFDAETGRMVSQVMSRDELTLVVSLLASGLKNQSDILARMRDDDLRRLTVRRDMDFTGQLIGKLSRAFDPEYWRGMHRSLLKIGLVLKESHESCPHKVKTLHAVEDAPGEEHA